MSEIYKPQDGELFLPSQFREVYRNKREIDPASMGTIAMITGVTGGGKDLLTNLILSRLNYKKIVTWASRKPRPGEIDGVDYHFTTKEDFEQKLEEDFFIEHANYGGYKGTSKDSLKDVMNGNNYVWRVDPSFAARVRPLYKKKFDPEIAELLQQRTKVLYLGVENLAVPKDRFFARENGSFNDREMRDDFRDRIREDWKQWGLHGDHFLHNEHVIMNNGSPEDLFNEAADILIDPYSIHSPTI